MRLPRRLARRLRGAALAGALGALVLPTVALAALPVDHVAVEATDVDRDGIIAPGDTITFDEVIRNTSSTADLGGLAATLTALTPKVVVQQGQSGYPLLGPLATGANLTPFQATLPSTIECGQNVGFSMALRSSSDSSNVVFDVGTGTAGPREAHESTDVPLPIPNGDRVVSTLGVPPGAIVKDVRVRIGHIRHDFVDDLSLALIGPDGARVPLVSNAGGSGDDYVDTVFARNGATIATAAAPFTGTYRAERLAEFAGKPAGGTWKLELRDSNAADAGTLLDWGLDISAATCAAQPVAHATATPNPALPGEPVVFDGSDSVDPRAPILRYEWDLDGDGTFETDTGLVPLAMRSYPVKGAHTAALRITDANGDTDTEEVPFAVTQRPVAGLAVSDATPLSGEEVTFDAGGSRDPDGALVRYEWDVNGDGTFERDTGGGARLATSFATPGPRSVRVRVTDDLGATAVTQLGVVVRNRAPTARLTGPAPAVAGATATLDARGSTDPDGRVERYQWDLDGDGVFETDGAATLDHVFTASGPRSVGVRVTDDSGATADGTLDVTVTERPTARIEATPNPARPSDVVTLDAAGSTDPEGPVARYEWDLDGDGSFETDTAGAATTARRFDAGDREVAVRVTDGDGAREVASITLQVVNRAPVAAFTTGPGPAVAGRPVTFDASASHDDDGTVVRYEWDLDGDGIFETDGGASPTAALTYANAGRFDVSLRVTDSDRTSTVHAETLTVEPAPAPAAGGDGSAGSGAGTGSAAGSGDAAPATGSGGPGPGGGSGGTSAGGGAGGGGSVARGFRPSLAGAAIQRLRTVLARGVRLTCRADRAARCTVALTLQLRDARRLGLAGKRAKRPVTVGRATAQASATADGRVVLRLSRKVQRRLRRARSVVLLVTGRAVAADGRRATLRRAVLVRR